MVLGFCIKSRTKLVVSMKPRAHSNEHNPHAASRMFFLKEASDFFCLLDKLHSRRKAFSASLGYKSKEVIIKTVNTRGNVSFKYLSLLKLECVSSSWTPARILLPEGHSVLLGHKERSKHHRKEFDGKVKDKGTVVRSDLETPSASLYLHLEAYSILNSSNLFDSDQVSYSRWHTSIPGRLHASEEVIWVS